MRRLVLAAIATLGLAGPAAAATEDPERAAILAVVDRFFAAMKARDIPALEGVIYTDGVMTIARTGPDGVVRHTRRPVPAWLEGIKAQDSSEERIWSPTVMRRGTLAVVWAPYDIRQQGKRLRCGVDSFDLVKLDGGWKIANLMFTAEPTACAELKAPG